MKTRREKKLQADYKGNQQYQERLAAELRLAIDKLQRAQEELAAWRKMAFALAKCLATET
jgi:hypothetical protein